MSLNPTFDSPVALFHKLERERYRAYHERKAIHKADHFFNFCVTAHSMCDYFFEYTNTLRKTDKRPHFDTWKQVPLLVAVTEIANLSKHFVLREHDGTPKSIATRRVRRTKDQFMGIYSDGSRRFYTVPVTAPEISVTLSDGSKYALYSFTTDVLKYWHKYLAQHGIRVRRQSFAQMSGQPLRRENGRLAGFLPS
jgi:hypothetical protein